MSPEYPIRDRLSRRNIPHNTVAALASEPKSVIYVQEVSVWAAGNKIPQHKFDRLMKVLVSLEELLDACIIAPDLRNPVMVRRALDRLPQIKKEQEADQARIAAAGPAVVAPQLLLADVAPVHAILGVDGPRKARVGFDAVKPEVDLSRELSSK